MPKGPDSLLGLAGYEWNPRIEAGSLPDFATQVQKNLPKEQSSTYRATMGTHLAEQGVAVNPNAPIVIIGVNVAGLYGEKVTMTYRTEEQKEQTITYPENNPNPWSITEQTALLAQQQTRRDQVEKGLTNAGQAIKTAARKPEEWVLAATDLITALSTNNGTNASALLESAKQFIAQATLSDQLSTIEHIERRLPALVTAIARMSELRQLIPPETATLFFEPNFVEKAVGLVDAEHHAEVWPEPKRRRTRQKFFSRRPGY